MVRVFDRRHLIELDGLDLAFAQRELFESAVVMGRKALKAVGIEPGEVERVEREYRLRDCERLERQSGDRRPSRRRGTRRSAPTSRCPTRPARRGRRRGARGSTSRGDERLADAAGEDQGQRGAVILLVARDPVEQRGPADARPRRGGSGARRRRSGAASRSASARAHRPSSAEKRSARTRPIATASPWSTVPSPASLSMAWAKLWPRLSSARWPLRSSTSPAIEPRLGADAVAIACSRERRGRRRAARRRGPRTRRRKRDRRSGHI